MKEKQNTWNRNWQITNRIVKCLYSVIAISLILLSLKNKDTYPALQCTIALLLMLIPMGINRLTKLEVPPDATVVYDSFCFATVICGSALRWYGQYPGWDKFVHFISGFLMALVGLAIYEAETVKSQGHTPLLKRVFILCVAITGATLWEFYEYGLYIFLGIDALNVKRTGIHDTLQDMLVCTLGALLMVMLIVRSDKKGKSGYLLRIWENFKATNTRFY